MILDLARKKMQYLCRCASLFRQRNIKKPGLMPVRFNTAILVIAFGFIGSDLRPKFTCECGNNNNNNKPAPPSIQLVNHASQSQIFPNPLGKVVFRSHTFGMDRISQPGICAHWALSAVIRLRGAGRKISGSETRTGRSSRADRNPGISTNDESVERPVRELAPSNKDEAASGEHDAAVRDIDTDEFASSAPPIRNGPDSDSQPSAGAAAAGQSGPAAPSAGWAAVCEGKTDSRAVLGLPPRAPFKTFAERRRERRAAAPQGDTPRQSTGDDDDAAAAAAAAAAVGGGVAAGGEESEAEGDDGDVLGKALASR
jgi:hypothetical protein